MPDKWAYKRMSFCDDLNAHRLKNRRKLLNLAFIICLQDFIIVLLRHQETVGFSLRSVH